MDRKFDGRKKTEDEIKEERLDKWIAKWEKINKGNPNAEWEPAPGWMTEEEFYEYMKIPTVRDPEMLKEMEDLTNLADNDNRTLEINQT